MGVTKHAAHSGVHIVSINEPSLVEGEMVQQCYEEIVDLIGEIEERCIVLHFGRVTFMASETLSMLIRLNKKCREEQIALKLCNMTPNIHHLFQATQLDRFFSIYDDLAQAIEAFTTAVRQDPE